LEALSVSQVNNPHKGAGLAHVELDKFCHGTPFTEVNSAIDSGPLLLTFMTVDASDAILFIYLK